MDGKSAQPDRKAVVSSDAAAFFIEIEDLKGELDCDGQGARRGTRPSQSEPAA